LDGVSPQRLTDAAIIQQLTDLELVLALENQQDLTMESIQSYIHLNF
jgi:hypothetical protein